MFFSFVRKFWTGCERPGDWSPWGKLPLIWPSSLPLIHMGSPRLLLFTWQRGVSPRVWSAQMLSVSSADSLWVSALENWRYRRQLNLVVGNFAPFTLHCSIYVLQNAVWQWPDTVFYCIWLVKHIFHSYLMLFHSVQRFEDSPDVIIPHWKHCKYLTPRDEWIYISWLL